MQTCALVCHPACAPLAVSGVEARWGIVGPWLQLRWRVEGAARVILPPFAGRERQDGLWQATCFEMFVQPAGGTAYAEYNFSPSEAYAAYDFATWREGMAERPLSHAPVISPRKGIGLFLFDVAIPLADLPALPAALSLTCVIEEEGGAKSYWAMDHGRSPQPDFHQAACFAASLAATETP
ncbi:DOMON-like domain-containing protein [Alteraurantiacibacter palmitatis]|uniref:DOMON-like domain-containing protein n=1 Tax=Alteraurantiacibacter palmitatis TaxID=2054628 RepID=A0ABV7E4F6_9SPHN